jgi:hypothetical protein
VAFYAACENEAHGQTVGHWTGEEVVGAWAKKLILLQRRLSCFQPQFEHAESECIYDRRA